MARLMTISYISNVVLVVYGSSYLEAKQVFRVNNARQPHVMPYS